MKSVLLASGAGWSVSDIVCTTGPGDRPFEERHEFACVAVVTSGTFQYRTRGGSAVLGPGGVLLGEPGTCFECRHDHGRGDRCLSFHFTPECLEEIATSVSGARRLDFGRAHMPPSPALVPALAMAEAGRDAGDGDALEEAALTLAGAALAGRDGGPAASPPPSPRDEARVSDVLRLVESRADEPLSLAHLAREAGTSRYHFLRVFKATVGLTPHQYVLRTRIQRAAVRLRISKEGVAAIAFEAGFGDLSSFNRRFRQVMGAGPRAYRRGARNR